MEHTENNVVKAATYEPALLSTPGSLIEQAAQAVAHGGRPGWTPRADGWTHERIRTFLEVLAQCGVVADAARAAEMSPQAAYALRNSARGRAFDVAWRAALLLARRRVADEVMSRALNGTVDVIMRYGEVWGERRRFDNRLTMAVLTRLDQQAASLEDTDSAPRVVADAFDEFIAEVCTGATPLAAFLAARRGSPAAEAGNDALVIRRLIVDPQGPERKEVWQPSISSISSDAAACPNPEPPTANPEPPPLDAEPAGSNPQGHPSRSRRPDDNEFPRSRNGPGGAGSWMG